MALLVFLLALIVFVLKMFGVVFGSVDMIALGLALLTLGFIVGGGWSYVQKTIAVQRRQ